MKIEECISFYEILDCIEEIGSTITKEHYIKYALEHVENAESFFRLAFNDTVYGINEKSFYNAFKIKGFDRNETYAHVSDYLFKLEKIGTIYADKKIPALIMFSQDIERHSGNTQLNIIYEFFEHLSPPKKKWWCRAVLHDLRMGANRKTINAVFKALGLKEIDKFSLQLANKIDIYDEADVSKKLVLPCIMECKYDGLRIQAEIYDNICILTSRRGKDRTYDFPEIVEALLYKFENRTVLLDGEIVKFYDDDKESFQGVMKKDGKGVRKYVVFDLLSDEDIDYKYRWSNLEVLFGEWHLRETIILADHYDCNNIKEAQEYFEHLLEKKREGIILKHLDAKYERGSRKHMFKCKPDYVLSMQTEHEADLLITGWKYGEGKNHDKVATLCLEDLSGKINVDVGSGMSDSDREILTNIKGELRGQICEIRYNEKTETGSLRFPRFIKLRKDKDEADDLSEVKNEMDKHT